MDASTLYTIGGLALASIIAFLLLQPTNFVKWLQRKNYQYEVTFSLYMLTPTEKVVFNSILFLAISMLSIASILYLPDHISLVSRRAYYYTVGDAELYSTSKHAAETLYGSAAGWASSAYQAAMNRTGGL